MASRWFGYVDRETERFEIRLDLSHGDAGLRRARESALAGQVWVTEAADEDEAWEKLHSQFEAFRASLP